MTDSPAAAPPSKLRDQAQWMELAATVAVVVLALNVARLWLPPLATITSASDAAGRWALAGELGRGAIQAAPAVLYLSGVGAAQRMFARMGKGDVLTAENAAGIASIGTSMLWGSAWAVLFAPTLLGWVGGTFSGLDLRLEGPEIVILVLGGALVMVGRVYAQAVSLQAEVDGFV